MPDNSMLPYEYQSQIDAANRRKMLAEALQKQAFGFTGAQGGGRIAPKTSPLTWLANTATGMLASSGAADAVQRQAGVIQQAEKDRTGEMLALLQAPEEQQQALGVSGKFPETRALADTLFKRKQDKLKALADTIKERDPNNAVKMLATGQLPGGEYKVPDLPDIVEKSDSAGNPYLVSTSVKGEKRPTYAPKPPVINNNIPKQENQASLDILEKDLRPRQDAAIAAKGVLASTSRAIDALQRGAMAGGLQDAKQMLRMALQGFGISAPATAETADLQLALETAILDNAQKIKPISNADIPTLRKMLGSIGTDPDALARALAAQQAQAIQGLLNYNDFVSEQSKTITDPLARQRLAGTTIGYEAPTQLSGPMAHQLEVIKQLQLAGADVSRFRDAEGRAFTPTDQINVRPTRGYPGVAAKPAAGKPPSLSEAEWIELQNLRRKVGGQ